MASDKSRKGVGVRKLIPTYGLLFFIFTAPVLAATEGSIKNESSTPSHSNGESSIDSYSFSEFPVEWRHYQGHPWDALKIADFKRSYRKIIGGKRAAWLQKMDAVAGPNRVVSTFEGKFIFMKICKPHDCGRHEFTLLFSPDQKKIYGRLQEESSVQWIGNPDERLQRLLEMLRKRRNLDVGSTVGWGERSEPQQLTLK